MPSILCRGFRYVTNPRAIAWRYIKKRYPKKPITTKLGKDLKVRIYPYDVIGKDIYVNGLFEPAECKLVMKFLKPGMVFFDVGANLGQYTLLAAKRVGISGQVHSFEPNSRMFAELQFNVRLNNLSDICRLSQLALSNVNGQGMLSKYEAGAEVYGSLGNHKRSEGTIIGYEHVKTATLDSYVERQGIDHVDLIKMDIEGAELLALKGARDILSQHLVRAIVLELSDTNTIGFGYKASEIWDYLESFGYIMHFFDKHGGLSGLAVKPVDFKIDQNLIAIKSNAAS